MTEQINIMLVDDSSIVRVVLRQILSTHPEFKICCEASDGNMALERIAISEVKPHVIILDIEMPHMDGITALPKIKELLPNTRVIIASTLSLKNASISLKALDLGASDYLPKPTSMKGQQEAMAQFSHELIEKVKVHGYIVKTMSGAQSTTLPPYTSSATKEEKVEAAICKKSLPTESDIIVTSKNKIIKPSVVAIGSSTGGPEALNTLLFNLKGSELNAYPIFITQHMPPYFTKLLADNLSKYSGRICKEAEDGEKVEAGKIYLAPGDYHMLIKPSGIHNVIKLTQDLAENFCRPAVDPMLRSLVEIYGAKMLIVILTGMGSDGLKGCQLAYDKGATIIAQDKETSVVWGMPGAVAKASICRKVLPLNNIAHTVLEICR